jgi:hypothetical protein
LDVRHVFCTGAVPGDECDAVRSERENNNSMDISHHILDEFSCIEGRLFPLAAPDLTSAAQIKLHWIVYVALLGAFSPELEKSAKPEDLPKVEGLDLQLVL